MHIPISSASPVATANDQTVEPPAVAATIAGVAAMAAAGAAPATDWARTWSGSSPRRSRPCTGERVGSLFDSDMAPAARPA
ncbi:hypothetical protein [Streptomyces sp. NPDC002845]